MGLTLDRSVDLGADPAETVTDTPVWMRMVLASVSVGAGVIHLAMVPSHAGDSTLEAVGFAAFGWAQIAAGIAMALRPTRRVLLALVAVHLAALSLWVWSRTSGLPFGAHPDEAAEVTGIDALAAAFAGVGVLGGCAALVLPGIGRRLGALGPAIGGAVAASALIGTSMVLASPSSA